MSMNEDINNGNLSGIPRKIIEDFLAKLAVDKLPSNVIAKLKTSILDKGDISEASIKAALSSED